MVQDPSTRNNCLIHHTRRHLQEIQDPGPSPQGPLKFSLRQFIRRRVSNGCGEGDLGENGHGGGGECCEEGEEEDGRGDHGERWEYEPVFGVLGILRTECLPKRPGRDTGPGNQQLCGVKH